MNRLKRLALCSISLCAILSVVFSCHQRQTQQVNRMIDSTLSASTDILFAHPERADSLYAALQRGVSDSAMFQLLNIFRATAHVHMGDSAGGERMFRSVEAWCRANSGNEKIEGQLWNHRGVACVNRGDMKEAVRCYQRSFDVMSRADKDVRLIATTINLADMYQQQGALPEAANYYRYALFLCDTLGENINRASILSGLALVYSDLYEFDLAHSYFRQAGAIIDNQPLITQFYYHFTLGNCLYFEQRYAESLQSFERAFVLNEKIQNPDFELKCEANMGEVCLMNNNLPEARRHLDRADSISHSFKTADASSLFYIRSLQADLAIAEGRSMDARSILGAPLLQQGIAPLRYQMLHYRRLQHYAERAGRWRQAYDMQSKAQHYADTLRSLQSMNSVGEMALRYQRDTTLMNQRLVLADYKVRNARQQMLIASGVALMTIVLLAIVLSVWFYRRRTRRRLEQQMDRITELRMDVVRNRVSPHYIFNVLGTIFPRLSQHPDVSVPIGLLIDVLRGNLLASGKVAVPLKDELQLVRNFVELHRISKGDYPRVEWNVSAEVADSGMLVPAMAVEIPVENALKHAFPKPDADSCISIGVGLAQDGTMLQITVADNGQGYNPGLVRHTGRDTGTGLRLISRTFEILNRTNARQASVEIENRPPNEHGTVVRIVVPVDYTYGAQSGD